MDYLWLWALNAFTVRHIFADRGILFGPFLMEYCYTILSCYLKHFEYTISSIGVFRKHTWTLNGNQSINTFVNSVNIRQKNHHLHSWTCYQQDFFPLLNKPLCSMIIQDVQAFGFSFVVPAFFPHSHHILLNIMSETSLPFWTRQFYIYIIQVLNKKSAIHSLINQVQYQNKRNGKTSLLQSHFKGLGSICVKNGRHYLLCKLEIYNN